MWHRVIALYRRFNIGLVLASSLLFKLFFIFVFKYRFYSDVIKAIRFGKSYFINKGDFFTLSINNKTFLGPLLWFLTYHRFSIWGLKIFNIICFILLFVIQYFLGRKIYKHNTIVIALFLFSFYIGTNLNIIAGEQDDNLAILLFSLGVLLYVYIGRVFLSSLLMGMGFLFKFSTGIFYVGFVLNLLIKRNWRGFLLSGLGMSIPFLCINFIDHFNSTRILLTSFAIQVGCSAWGNVWFKLFSTGILFSFLMSLWVCLKEKNDFNLLFFMISSSYLFYVLINRDAYAASYIMMQSILFSSFLIAEFLLKNEYFGKGTFRNFIIGGILILYLLISTLVIHHNISQDTTHILKETTIRERVDSVKS
jgi:hypothetical protein